MHGARPYVAYKPTTNIFRDVAPSVCLFSHLLLLFFWGEGRVLTALTPRI